MRKTVTGWVCGAMLAVVGTAAGENIAVPRGDLQPSKLMHRAAAAPHNWRIVGNVEPRAWMLPGGTWALALPANAAIEQTVTLPALAEDRRQAAWYALFSVDLAGAEVDGASIVLEAFNPDSGAVLASQRITTEGTAPVGAQAAWRITASSENLGQGADYTPIALAFDGNPGTFWHSRYQGAQDALPHRITIDFGEVRPVRTITCLPRQDRSPNGIFREYAVYISNDGTTWNAPIARGRFNEPLRQEQRINLPPTTRTRYLAIEAIDTLGNGPFASAAEIRFLPAPPAEQTPTMQRAWLHIPADTLTNDREQRMGLRIRHDAGAAAIITNARLTRLHPQPSQRLLGRSNGGLGPDLLAAGAFGFDALLEHEQHVLAVTDVRDGSPAAHAGLKRGDVIVAVDGNPLPVNTCDPGWRWLEHGHEAVLGRAVLDAVARPAHAGGSTGMVRLQVLRAGRTEELLCRLNTPGPFAQNNWPRRNATVNVMLNDMIEHLARTQRDNGEWGGYIRTSLAGLALLSTRDQKYLPHVKRAVDWALNEYPTPFAFGTLGHWPCAYTGLLVSEYYLATGDQRVLPWLEANLRWAAATFHNSAWDMPTLGHGPPHLPYDNKSLVAPTVHLLLFEALARRAGIRSAIWDECLPFVMHAWSDPAQNGHGALGYNASHKDLEEFWSRTGLFALVCHHRRELPHVIKAAANIMRERFPWWRNSHAYGEPGGALGLIGLAQIDSRAFAEVMRELAFTFALAWEPGYGLRYTTPHMGAPYMEGDVTMNALYALVFTAAERRLHMTGATDRNWADVAMLPVRASQVRGWRDAQQRVHLLPRVPGAPVHFRLDGREPTASDPVYREPFPLNRPAVVTARTITPQGETGPVMRLQLGLPKTGWRVVDATGHTDRDEAIRRAQRAIDGLPHVAWLTDVGHRQNAYPHHVVIDTMRVQPIGGIRLQFVDAASAPTHIRLALSRDGREWTEVAAPQWENFQQERTIDLTAAHEARFVRFEALQSATNQLLQLAEIELFPPGD